MKNNTVTLDFVGKDFLPRPFWCLTCENCDTFTTEEVKERILKEENNELPTGYELEKFKFTAWVEFKGGTKRVYLFENARTFGRWFDLVCPVIKNHRIQDERGMIS